MKHPFYKNDYVCDFSLNLKNIIKDNKKEEKELNNKGEYIVIIINNGAGNLRSNRKYCLFVEIITRGNY